MRTTSCRCRTTFSAQRRTAWATDWRSGNWRTGELKDLVGIANRLLTLQRAVVLKRRPFGMAVRIAGRDVKAVQYPPLLNEFPRNAYSVWQLLQEPGHDIPPSLLPQVKMQSFHGFLCRLLSSKARPLVATSPSGVFRLFQVSR